MDFAVLGSERADEPGDEPAASSNGTDGQATPEGGSDVVEEIDELALELQHLAYVVALGEERLSRISPRVTSLIQAMNRIEATVEDWKANDSEKR